MYHEEFSQCHFQSSVFLKHNHLLWLRVPWTFPASTMLLSQLQVMLTEGFFLTWTLIKESAVYMSQRNRMGKMPLFWGAKAGPEWQHFWMADNRVCSKVGVHGPHKLHWTFCSTIPMVWYATARQQSCKLSCRRGLKIIFLKANGVPGQL